MVGGVNVILEIGPAPGCTAYPGSVTVDCTARGDIDHVAKWGDDNLPFDDNTFDKVYASHVLEHVPWHLTQAALGEVLRVLSPGGVFEVWVPNLEVIVQVYLSGKFPAENWTPYNPEREVMKWVAGRLYNRPTGNNSWHLACFDERYLRKCLEEAGFVALERLTQPPGGQRIGHGIINLGMKGVKP